MSVPIPMRQRLGQAVLRGSKTSLPTSVYIALYEATPGPTGAGEASVGRRKVYMAVPDSAGVTHNSTAVAWYNIHSTRNFTHVGLWSAATGGYCMLTEELADSVSVSSGQGLRLPAGALAINWE